MFRGVILFCVFISGCFVRSAATVPLQKERAVECENLCRVVDMQLGAMVVIMDHVGCVCEPANKTTGSPSSAAASGGATIHMVVQQRLANQMQSASSN